MADKAVCRSGDIMSNRAAMIRNVETVFANRIRVITIGAPVTDGHVMATGSPTVFAENKNLDRISDLDSKKHVAVQGSPNVFSG
jgi:hypothetical protein